MPNIVGSYFEQHWSDKQEWVDEAKAMVRDLWLEYKSQAVQPDFHITKPQRAIKSKFDRHRRANPVSPSPASSPASAPDDWDEYERCLAQTQFSSSRMITIINRI